MKYIFQMKSYWLLAGLILMLLNSCVEKDPIARISQVLLVPLSPNAPSVDFEINNTRYATTVGYSTTTGTVRYTLPYYTVEPNSSSKISYKFNGRTDDVAFINTSLEDEKVYSTFLIDSFTKVKAVIVNDDLTEPNEGKVKVRFFHFCPNAPAIDVEIVAVPANTKLFLNRTFNDQNSNTDLQKFIEVPAGSYTFVFKDKLTSAVLYTTTAQTFLPDRIYTVAIRGFVAGTGTQAIGGWVYPNLP